MKKRNNEGYSLIELIIVIAIIAIVTAGASILFINWQKQYLNDCVKKIDTALSAEKVEGTSKETTQMLITQEDDGLYHLSMTGTDKKTLGDKKVKIYFVTEKDSSTEVEITKDQPLTISYDRVTGGFQPIDIGGEKTNCTEIRVKRDGKEVRITLVSSTGKHSVTRIK